MMWTATTYVTMECRLAGRLVHLLRPPEDIESLHADCPGKRNGAGDFPCNCECHR